MNIDIIYTNDGTGIIWLAGKYIYPQDISEANSLVLSDDRFKNVNYAILNFLNCTEFNISTENIPQLAEEDFLLSQINKNLHVAILSPEPYISNIAEAWKKTIDDTGWNIEIFGNKQSGIKWLEDSLKIKVPNILFEKSFIQEPIHIRYFPEKNLLIHKGSGKIVFGDFINFYKRLNNYKLKPNYKVIADYSDAFTQLTFNDLLTMAHKRSDTANNMGKISIALVGKTELIKNLLKIYKALLDKEQFKVEQFNSRLEAEAWLKV